MATAPSAVISGGVFGKTNEAFEDGNFEERTFADRKRKFGSLVDVSVDVTQLTPTTSINIVDNGASNGTRISETTHYGLYDEEIRVVEATSYSEHHGRCVPEAAEDIDYEGKQMKNIDDDEYENFYERSIEYMTSSSDVREVSPDESNRRRCRTPGSCMAEAKINCSKFGRVMRHEAREVREEIRQNVHCPSGRQCCTVEKVARRIPIIKWLPKYR